MTNVISNAQTNVVVTDDGWTDVADAGGLSHIDRGVAALVTGPDGPEPVAIFRLTPLNSGDIDLTDPGTGSEWYAVSHIEPQSGAPIMARGLVGSLTPQDSVDSLEVSTVASPLLKQRYDLSTGRCIDDESLSLESYEVRISDGRTQVKKR